MTTKNSFSIYHHRIGCSLPIIELIQASLIPFPLVTSILLSVSMCLILFGLLTCLLYIYIYILHTYEITQYVYFSDELISFCIKPFRSIHVVTDDLIFLVFMAECCYFVYIMHSLSINVLRDT